MKICFVHEEYPSETNFGGIATYQKIIAEYYANHNNRVCVITRGKEDIDYYENNVHVFRVASKNNSNNFFSVINYRKKVAKILRKLQDNNEIDIIETPDWGANTIFFEKYRNVPIVVRLHTPLKIWLDYNKNNFGISKKLILKWEDKMIERASALTSCSELLKDMVLKTYKINKDVIVVPNPYNKKDFYQSNKKTNNDFIFVGSLEERKGAIILANALNVVFSKIKNNKIYLIGKDTTRNNKNISTKKYFLQIVDKKYHNRIKFIGQIENEEINKYLNKSNLAIFPSLFDNYPYVVLEAMATGKNILISDNMGVKELVEKDNYVFKTGDSSDLANKILEFYNAKKPFINKNNIKIVDNECNPKKVCAEMKKIYQKTIDEEK